MTDPHAGAASDDDARELARWTHAWAAAAALTLAQMDAVWDDAHPAGSVGARDALALVLVDAVRNTYRGAVNVLGQRDAAVAAFDAAVPDLIDLRDRFEHFDAYLSGAGRAQADRRGPLLDAGGATRLSISASSGGGPEGHTSTAGGPVRKAMSWPPPPPAAARRSQRSGLRRPQSAQSARGG